MGECSCSPKEKYFKIGDEIIYLEKWEACDVCGAIGLVRLGVLTKEYYDIHCIDEKKLFKFPYCGTNEIEITADYFKKDIEEAVEEAIEDIDTKIKLTDKDYSRLINNLPKLVIKLLRDN